MHWLASLALLVGLKCPSWQGFQARNVTWFIIWRMQWHVLEGMRMWQYILCLMRVMWLFFANVELKYGTCFLSCWCKCGQYNPKYIKIWLHLRFNVQNNFSMGELNPNLSTLSKCNVKWHENSHINTADSPSKTILVKKKTHMSWRSVPPTPFSNISFKI